MELFSWNWWMISNVFLCYREKLLFNLQWSFLFFSNTKRFLVFISHYLTHQQQHERKNLRHDNSQLMILTNLVSSFTNLAHDNIILIPGWSVHTCFYKNFTPGWNLAPVLQTGASSPRGEISTRLWSVNFIKTLTKDRGDFTPGRVSPRGEI